MGDLEFIIKKVTQKEIALLNITFKRATVFPWPSKVE
jgi:hypothetical protein